MKEILEKYIPLWNTIEPEEQKLLLKHSSLKDYKSGEKLDDVQKNNIGLIVNTAGLLRVYGRLEQNGIIPFFRLAEKSFCQFSPNSSFQHLKLDICIEVMHDCQALIVPSDIIDMVVKRSLIFSNYINQQMTIMFSDVLWLLEQIHFYNLDHCLAAFLLEYGFGDDTPVVNMTSGEIASRMGVSTEENVLKMLAYFESEQYITIKKNTIVIKNKPLLSAI